MIASASELGHRFDQGWLFRHVEFSARAGDRLLVKGRNGSGKSTFLKCIAGLMIPREGQIVLPKSVGYAALDLNLYPELTAREHLQLAADMRNCEVKADSFLESVGLTGQSDKPCRTFSTGMRARLKLALALQPNPDLLILDEPTAALDQDGRELIDKTLGSFAGAVIYASNDEADGRWATHVISL